MSIKKQIDRFRAWQKEPRHYSDQGMEEQHCPVCGQQAGDGRITWRWVWKSILDVWGMDSRSLPYTLLQLLLRPGYLIGDYISGHRQACYKPVNMLFIVAIFYAIIAQLFGHDNTETLQVSTGNEPTIITIVFAWLAAHPAWATLSLTMIMILPTYILFRFAPRHTRHKLPESIFIQLFMSTLMLICALASKLVDWLFWLIPFYYYFTYRQFFGYRPWETIWRLMACAYVWILLLCTILITSMLLIDPLSEDSGVVLDLSINNLGTFYSILIVLGGFLLLASIPLAVGYLISRKSRHSSLVEEMKRR